MLRGTHLPLTMLYPLFRILLHVAISSAGTDFRFQVLRTEEVDEKVVKSHQAIWAIIT